MCILVTMPTEIRLPTAKKEISMPPGTEEIIQSDSSDDQIDVIKATYESEIIRIHETYQ